MEEKVEGLDQVLLADGNSSNTLSWVPVLVSFTILSQLPHRLYLQSHTTKLTIVNVEPDSVNATSGAVSSCQPRTTTG
jgi:hypothetical protein